MVQLLLLFFFVGVAASRRLVMTCVDELVLGLLRAKIFVALRARGHLAVRGALARRVARVH